MAENQHWAFVIDRLKSSLEPSTHGILVNAEQAGDFVDRIATVALDKAVVGVTFSHGVIRRWL